MAIDKNVLDQLLAGRDPQELFAKDGLLDELKKALSERMRSAEIDAHLENEGAEGAINRHNGSSRKTMLTGISKVTLDVPRDRAGTFNPKLIAECQRRFPDFDGKIMFQAGGRGAAVDGSRICQKAVRLHRQRWRVRRGVHDLPVRATGMAATRRGWRIQPARHATVDGRGPAMRGPRTGRLRVNPRWMNRKIGTASRSVIGYRSPPHRLKTADMNGWIVRVERALMLLASRLDAPPSLEEMAAAASVSPFHFHRIWRAMTGETVGQTVARLRVASAQRRLADGDLSITEIAMKGGFGSSQSFARAFRRVTDMSPTQFLSSGAARVAVAAKDDAQMRIELRECGEVVAMRRVGGAYRDLNALFWQLWNWVEGAGKLDGLQGIYGIPLGDPISVAEDRLRYDACLALNDAGIPPAPFERLTLPRGDYATLRHTGSYDGLETSNQRLVEAVLASGREPADFPLFHHFFDDPEAVAADALRTDILIRLDSEESSRC